MDTGLGPVTVRTVARDNAGAGALFRHVLGLKIAWAILCLAALLIVAPILRHDPTVIRACYLLGISSPIRSYASRAWSRNTKPLFCRILRITCWNSSTTPIRG